MIYTCENCQRTFSQKSHHDAHIKRKRPCKKDELNETVQPVQVSSSVEPTMIDYTTKTREELIVVCKQRNIKGYSGKKKGDIEILIREHDIVATPVVATPSVATQDTPSVATQPTTETSPPSNLELLDECLKQKSIKEVATILNLCVGTVRRWIELKDVPVQYTFDLYKILSMEIDYTKYASSLKDQFFTPTDVAQKCWNTFINEVKINIDDYTFIEPSAGDGSFLKVLPRGSIGLDIEPRSSDIQKQDYLTWKPPQQSSTSNKYIVFGNPPFGLRGHLALNFINHSYAFADYVCFILPQLFESDGKGSPRKRVKGYNLIYSEGLSAMFYSPENQEVKVNGVFQIWSKHTENQKYTIKTNSEDDMKVYSLSDGGTVASTRNKDMIGNCDIYIPSTCFGKENMRIYDSFDELPGKKGYGIVFFKNKNAMIEKAHRMDWSSISFLSTNSAYNLRTSIIFDALLV